MTKYKVKYPCGVISELQGKTACVLKDNGNGFHVKFKSHRSSDQDVIMTLEYDQADYLYHCLKKWKDS